MKKTPPSHNPRSSLKLTNLRFQVIIHATEDPSKVFDALNTLIPPEFKPILPENPEPTAGKLKSEYTRVLSQSEGYYKNPLTLVNIEYTNSKLIDRILRHWGKKTDEVFKEQFASVITKQLQSSKSSFDFYIRMNRHMATHRKINLLHAELAPQEITLEAQFPGNSIQTRLHFDRPYVSGKNKSKYPHPYYEQILNYFQLRGLISP